MEAKQACTPVATPRLVGFADDFYRLILRQGYSKWTARFCTRLTKSLCEAIAERGISLQDLDDDTANTLIAEIAARLCKTDQTTGRSWLERFRNYLIEHGDAATRFIPPADMSPRACLGREYQSYLKDQRGLADSTIVDALRFCDRFFTFRFGDALGELDDIKPEDITSFILMLRDNGVRSHRSVSSKLRNLFKFLFWSGRTSRDLGKAVLSQKIKKPTNIPRYLPPQKINRLLKAARQRKKTGRRDYAMLLLMARLGLRAPEVVAMKLEDINWRAGETLVRGKGQLHEPMPLTAEVGEALVDYIRHERRGSERTLFVLSIPPFHGFANRQILHRTLKAAYHNSGVSPPRSNVGSNVFRHSLATDMLRKGASLAEIGDMLRHRAPMTTTIYARHNVEALQSITRPWPKQQ